MIDLDGIRLRRQQTAPLLDERDRRLFAANEAMAHGYGRVMAVSAATDLARSTINREIREVCSNRHEVVERVRRPGAGRKTAVTHQPGLPAALETLIEDAMSARYQLLVRGLFGVARGRFWRRADVARN